MWQFITNWFAGHGTALFNTILRVVIIAALGFVIMSVINRIVKKMLVKSSLEKAAHTLIRTLIKTVMSILLALILAASVGIDVTGIVALASIVSLAVSLALQNMLTNIVGGFTLLYTHPFGSGDYVEIAGQSGTVKEIGMAYTTLTTPDNKLVSIPNSAVTSAEIVNYSVTGTRRVNIDISASYDSAPEQVIKTLKSLADHPAILADPAPNAVLTGYGESVINYSLRVWTKTEDYWTVFFDINQRLPEAFRQHGGEMSYPHLNVHLEK